MICYDTPTILTHPLKIPIRLSTIERITHTHTHLVTNPLSNYICILRKLIAFLQILYFFRLSIINYNY